MALPPLVAADQLIRAVWGNAVVQALRNSMAGLATEAHQIFQSTGVEEAEAFDKPGTGEAFLLHGQTGLAHLALIPETKLASDVTDQLYSQTELDTVVDAAVASAVISWATTGNTGRLPRSKMSAQSAVVKATAAGQLFYATGSGQISALTKGNVGEVLTTGDAPSWAPPVTPTVRVLTASGTWSKPTGLVWARVRVQGAGADGSVTSGNGGGGYCEKLYAAADLDATEAYTIDAASSTFKALTGSAGLSDPDARQQGGAASGGDLNIPGGSGATISPDFGGQAFLGSASGRAGTPATAGDGLGYGAGGSASRVGAPGVVIVEEFSLA